MQAGQAHQVLDLHVWVLGGPLALLHQARHHPHVLHALALLLQRSRVETDHLVDIQEG